MTVDVIGRPAAGPATPLRVAGPTLAAAVRRVAETAGDTPALTFVDYATDRAGLATTVTYAELDARARALAVELDLRCSSGARVAVMCPHAPDYIVAFLGCLYAGVVAVPLYAPETVRSNDRLRRVLLDAEPEWILTSLAAREAVVGAQRMELRIHLRGIICVDEVPIESADAWTEVGGEPGEVAYLQYTSGSTSDPAGVRITHRNMLTAAEQIRVATPWLGAETTLVSWVPYFHDLGLITGVVLPLYLGAHAVHLTPTAFIQDPYRWLDLIHRYRADWTTTANFGLDLCTRRLAGRDLGSLDLSCLTVLLNGGEAVRWASWESFLRAFEGCGLRPAAYGPGYGLAEATLGVTSYVDDMTYVAGVFDRNALATGWVVECRPEGGTAVTLLSCGVALPGMDVRVVDPQTLEALPDGRVGEIWVSGPNVADGYWGQPERTEQVFAARLSAADGARIGGRWLRTGDLGFIHRGLYYIAGRCKELIILAGRNHYPADLESTALAAHPDIRPAGAAAFAVLAGADDEERLVIVVEALPGADRDQIVSAIRAAVTDGHGCVAEVQVVRPGAIPRTTSRKVQHGECRDRYLRGELRTRAGQA